MRSAVIVAALTAGVLAAPYQKRDEVVVTDVDVVYATDVVTVMATNVESTTASVEYQAPSSAPEQAFQEHAQSWGGSAWWTPSVESSTASTTYVAPTTPTMTFTPPPSSTTTYVPSPPPTTTTTPTEVSSAWSAATSWAASADTAVVATGTTATGAPITWTSSAAYTGYSDVVVLHHNFHRHNHSSPVLTWNETLAKSAQDLANQCVYEHNTELDGGGYGQNIAAGVDMNNVTSVITDLFYNGEVGWFDGLYGQAQPDMTHFENWGHFSQIVWAATTSVACATANCTANGLGNVGGDVDPYFTVCNYYPAGNFANDYGANIGTPIGIPTIPWDAS